MKLVVLLTSLIYSMALHAELPSAIDHWNRLESMVRTGAITEEAAKKEMVHNAPEQLEKRKEAQRSLASIEPDLKPMRVKQLKIEPMVLFLD